MTIDGDREARSPRSARALAVLATGMAFAFVTLMALGVWQVQRLHWKLGLLAQIDSRIHAAPVPAPALNVDASDLAYLRVKAAGVFLNDKPTFVQAVTRLGSGFWMLVPLHTDQGFTILVNRGFVPSASAASVGMVAGRVEVTGLLRLSEPKGGFLRSNDSAADRWFSRDVAAIGQARGLTQLAPYFIDADGVAGDGQPVGGLTVVDLPNNHLVYALTWFGLAVMVVGWAAYIGRDEWRARRR